MQASDVRARAFAMPLTSPAYPMGPYRFVNREFLSITCRVDPQELRGLVPDPLRIEDPLVKFEFIRASDSPSRTKTTLMHAGPTQWRATEEVEASPDLFVLRRDARCVGQLRR